MRGDRHGVLGVQRFCWASISGHIRAINELHDDVEQAVLRLAKIIDTHDAGMGELAIARASFLKRSAKLASASSSRVGEDLDGDGAVQRDLRSLVNRAHAATPSSAVISYCGSSAFCSSSAVGGCQLTSGLFRRWLRLASGDIFFLHPLSVKLGLVLACAFVFAGPVFSAPAEEPRADDPGASPEIALLRLGYERGLIEASLAPVKQQITTLAMLEKQFAAARDYDAAITARDERKRLQGELTRLDKDLLLLQTREQALKTALLPDRVKLPLESATLKELRFEGGAITGWSKTGAAATWKLPSLPAGGYEVLLRYRCGAAEGGTLLVKETRYSLTATIESTLKGPEERNAGTLKISDGSGTLHAGGGVSRHQQPHATAGRGTRACVEMMNCRLPIWIAALPAWACLGLHAQTPPPPRHRSPPRSSLSIRAAAPDHD
jgi:hypothetical protein